MDESPTVSNVAVKEEGEDPEARRVHTLTEGPSSKGFAIGLYLEHLEEASFLYDQRLVLLDDPELTWLDLEEFEERFEAHIDALTLGEDLALAVCQQQAEKGDFGELHAAIRVFCRKGRSDLVQAQIESLDPEDEERCRAVRNAMCHEMPAEWQYAFVQRLMEGQPAFTKTTVRALGYRRLPAADSLLKAVSQADDNAIPDVVWALGRLRDPVARPLLYNTYLQHDAAAVQAGAALALLRIGEPAALQYCLARAHSHQWALLPIGLGGSRSNVGVLVEIAASDAASPECMLALGLLGEVSAVEPLLYHLGDARLAESSSIALYLITGAELFEDVFIPEPADEDGLFEDEGERTKNEEENPPAAEDPRGTTIQRLSRQPEIWQEWWRQNRTSFKRGVRYRNGSPYAPEKLLENLTTEWSPNLVRRLASEELVIRYGCDLPFEIDMLVARQKEVLDGVGTWLHSNGGSFTKGRWYMAGRVSPS